MAAGILAIAGCMPARDRNGGAVQAQLTFYVDGTTTIAPVYTSTALTTAHAQPIQSDSSGRFPPIYADTASTFTAGWSTDDGQARTYTGVTPAQAAAAALTTEAQAAAADAADARTDALAIAMGDIDHIVAAVDLANVSAPSFRNALMNGTGLQTVTNFEGSGATAFVIPPGLNKLAFLRQTTSGTDGYDVLIRRTANYSPSNGGVFGYTNGGLCVQTECGMNAGPGFEWNVLLGNFSKAPLYTENVSLYLQSRKLVRDDATQNGYLAAGTFEIIDYTTDPAQASGGVEYDLSITATDNGSASGNRYVQHWEVRPALGLPDDHTCVAGRALFYHSSPNSKVKVFMDLQGNMDTMLSSPKLTISGAGLINSQGGVTCSDSVLAVSRSSATSQANGSLKFFIDGNEYGRVSVGSTGNLQLGAVPGGATQWEFTPSAFRPIVDNVASLGTASFRPSQLFAGTSSVSVSDGRLKRDIRPITAAEKAAARAVDLVAYRFNDAFEEKGEAARWHVGVTAQQVIEAFAAQGLDAFRYGIVGSDPLFREVDVPFEEQRQAEEEVEEQVASYEIVEGKAVLTLETKLVKRPAFDRLPVVDADGAPVMEEARSEVRGPAEETKGAAAMREALGLPQPTIVMRAARPARQAVHVVPRMETVARTHKEKWPVSDATGEPVREIAEGDSQRTILGVRYEELLTLKVAANG